MPSHEKKGPTGKPGAQKKGINFGRVPWLEKDSVTGLDCWANAKPKMMLTWNNPSYWSSFGGIGNGQVHDAQGLLLAGLRRICSIGNWTSDVPLARQIPDCYTTSGACTSLFLALYYVVSTAVLNIILVLWSKPHVYRQEKDNTGVRCLPFMQQILVWARAPNGYPTHCCWVWSHSIPPRTPT